MCLAVVVSARLCMYVYAFMRVSLSVYIYLKSNSLDMFEGRTTLTKLLRFAFLHAHVLCVCMFGHSRVHACLDIHDVCVDV